METNFSEAIVASEYITRQLGECGRIFDLKGNPLSLSMIEEIAYEIKRYREVNSTIDILTTDGVRNQVGPVVVEKFKKLYGIDPGDFREMLKPSPVGPYLEFSFPAVRIAFFSIGDNDPPSMWMLDFSDMTKEFALMTPKKHALILGFKGIIE